ncbi:MAG: hypothetical protein ACLRRT_13480 [Ruthenibacterium lactatiformans]
MPIAVTLTNETARTVRRVAVVVETMCSTTAKADGAWTSGARLYDTRPALRRYCAGTCAFDPGLTCWATAYTTRQTVRAT